MPGSPVSLGCAVILSPGAAGPPDSGVITTITQATLTANGMPLATAGSIATMTNSLSGVPYMLPIGSTGVSTGVSVSGQGLVRLGDRIPSGPGVMTILGPPAAPFVTDGNAP
jgi:hypothetical protein